jgi:LCP family protein required for cell wall assembly
LTTFIVLIIILASVGGYLGWKFVQNEVRIFGWKGLWSLLFPGKLKGEDSGHVNILLVGNSADDPGHPGSQLTDSLMLISINTNDHSAFMLSIPRDLYVNIPNNGYAKVNETYQDGQAEHFSSPGYPSGGMGLLEEVVSQKLNVSVDYYALVNYSALRDAVNAVGGVTVNIKSGDPRGLYDPNISPVDGGPLKLANGSQKLNGQTALNLARARGDSYYSYGFPRADFDRTEHQRQLLVALKDKATSLGVLANPFRLADLFDVTGKNVKTDMSLGNVRRLYGITKKIKSSDIKSVGLNDATVGREKHVNLLQSYATSTGQSALVPAAGIDTYTEIDHYINQLLGQ